MEKIFVNKLFKTLIDFNFFFFEKKILKNKRIINKIHQAKILKQSYALLEPAEIIKSLKQTLRFLHYLNKQQNKKLNICFKNVYFFRWFQFLLKKNNINRINLTKNLFLKSSKDLNVIFSIGFNYNNYRFTRIIKKLFSEKYFLINRIDSNVFKNDLGIYRFFNDINSWKKVLLLFIFIKTLYKKNN